MFVFNLYSNIEYNIEMMQKIKNNIFKTEIFLYNKIEFIILTHVIVIILFKFVLFIQIHEFKSKLPLNISNTRIFE